jgi:hypothetical protein
MQAEVRIGVFAGCLEEIAREAEARVRNPLSDRDALVLGEQRAFLDWGFQWRGRVRRRVGKT